MHNYWDNPMGDDEFVSQPSWDDSEDYYCQPVWDDSGDDYCQLAWDDNVSDYDDLKWDEDTSDYNDSLDSYDDFDSVPSSQEITLASDFLPKIPVRHKKKTKQANKEKKKGKKKSKHKSGKAGLKELRKDSKIKRTKDKNLAAQLREMFDFDEREIQTPYMIAQNYVCSHDILVCNDEILFYEPKYGFYKAKSKSDVKREILDDIPRKYHSKIKIAEIKAAFDSLILNQELQSDLKPIQNKPFINCLSGVVDVQEFEEYPHSPKYGFTDCIQARFDPDASGEEWEKFMQAITTGDEQLYKLIQEAFGYAVSTYSNARVMFIVYGPSTTGKSLILAVLRSVIGEDLVSSVTIQQLEKQEYVAEMNGKKVNIAADLPNTPLGDVGTLKALVSNLDTVSARKLFHGPENQKGVTKVFCSTNHLLKFKNPDPADLEAVFNRIIFLPLLNVIKSEDVDTNLVDTLLEERDYIFTWAVKGLRRYLKNGERFTKSDASEKIKNQNITQYNFAKVFANEHIEPDESSWVLKTDVAKAFYAAAADAGLPKPPKTEIYNCLEQMGITGVKETVEGLGQQWIFRGIRFK